MPSDPIITKRLHISGLTPSLTSADLSQRISSFGDVKSLDGFNLLDGLGQPRKFGYVTIETTAPKLAKCLNVLSGSTWKGAKLRIGEAKPDFRERLKKETDDPEPPRKKRRRAHGIEAPDMSLITPENVAGRGCWKVTPMGRLIRPIRIRPGKPLPCEMQSTSMKAGQIIGAERKRKRSRVKAPPGRARRRTIDPLKWGSTHLKDVFIDVQGSGRQVSGQPDKMDDLASEVQDSDEDEVLEETLDEKKVTLPPPEPSDNRRSTTLASQEIISHPPNNDIDIFHEKIQSLALLESLFGDKNDTEWIGRESLGSDIGEHELRIPIEGKGTGDAVEEVPMEVDGVADEDFTGSEAGVDLRESEPEPEESETLHPHPSDQTEPKTQQTKLKDLFTLREDEGGFSLLGHLDLDLELDDEIPIPKITTAQSSVATYTTAVSPTALPGAGPLSNPIIANYDPKQPLFFPSTSATKGKLKDPLDVAREGGWHWRDPDLSFWRTDTEEGIRKRWEEQKVELTRDWKRRWREAGKMRRRRGGDDGD